MNEVWQSFSEAFQAVGLLEWIAVVCALIYVLLAARENIWCWFWGGVGSAVGIYVAISAQLYVFAVENLYYLFASVYGYALWRRGVSAQSEKVISRCSLRFHFWGILVVSICSLLLAECLLRFTDQAAARVDCLTTGFAFWATYLLAQKRLENWLYWVVVDGVFVVLCMDRQLYAYAALYLFYTIWAGYAYVLWRRKMLEQNA